MQTMQKQAQEVKGEILPEVMLLRKALGLKILRLTVIALRFLTEGERRRI